MSVEPRINVVDARDLEELVIVLQGDPHVGSKHFDEDLFKRHVEWAAKKGIYWLNMGDALETATRDSVGAGVYEQDEIVQEQLEHYVELMQPLSEQELILGHHRGNHEARVWKSSGIDLTKMLQRELGGKYFGVGVCHILRVGNQTYTMYTTHGSSGARLPHTKIKKAMDMANMVDVDIYGMAHLHTLSHHAGQFYRPNLRNKTLEQNEKHFIITGAYLDHWGSYAHEGNLEPGKKGSARIKLFGDEKLIKVSI